MLRMTFVWVLFFLACSAGSSGAEDKAIEALEAKGQSLFSRYCSHCHGIKGEGDGYNSEFLEKEPANLADRSFISKKSNDQLFRVISLGGIGVKKSPLMPTFGNTLSGEDIWSLIAFIRKLSGDDSHQLVLPPDVGKSKPEAPSFIKKDFQKYLLSVANEEQRKTLVTQGEMFFKKKKSCIACHRVGDEGGKVGPDFSRAGFLYKPEWLFTWIPNPQRMHHNTPMPSMPMDRDEISSITAYLIHMGSSLPPEWKPYLEKKGDLKRGEMLFFDTAGKANCSKCHQINGKGGLVGPDLSIVGSSRTSQFILESILNPSRVVTVGYTSVSITTKDDKILTGVIKSEDESSIEIADKEGHRQRVSKDQIKKINPQSASIMPGNFKEILTVEEIRDVLAFLETLTSSVVNELLSNDVGAK